MMPPAETASAPAPTAPEEKALPGARLVLGFLLTINLFNYMDRNLLAAVEPKIRDELLPGDPHAMTKMGLLATAFLVAFMVFAPLFAWLAERMSRWHIIAIGVGLWSLASGASGLAGAFHVHHWNAVWQIGAGTVSLAFLLLLFTRCLVGVGEGAFGPLGPAMISDYFPIRQRGAKMAWYYLAYPVGAALGYAFGGAMASLQGQVLASPFGDIVLGWRWAFYLVVPPGLLLAVLALFMKEPPREAIGQAKRRKLRLADALVLARTPSYVLNTLGMTGMLFALGGLAFWVPAYLQYRRETWNETTSLFGIEGTTVFGGITLLAGFLATLLGGVAGDMLRPRFAGSYFLVSGVAMLVAFPCVVLIVRMPFPACWILVFVAAFCIFFNTGPSNTILANVTHPSLREAGFALNIFFVHAFGDAISPPVVGRVADWLGLDMGFQVVSASVLVGGLFWLWGARYLKRDEDLAPTRLADG